MSEMESELPVDIEADDLGLTARQWMDLHFLHAFGLLEPAEGGVEDKAFRIMDANAYMDYMRRCERNRKDAEYWKQVRAQIEGAATRQAERDESVWDCDDPRAVASSAEADPEPEAEP